MGKFLYDLCVGKGFLALTQSLGEISKRIDQFHYIKKYFLIVRSKIHKVSTGTRIDPQMRGTE